jgi:LPS sulfotransferase NodH
MPHPLAPRFVICSDLRTGSHMLATALNGHSQLRVAGEIVVRPQLFGLPPRRPGEPARSFARRIVPAACAHYHGCIIHRRHPAALRAVARDPAVKILFLTRDDWLAQFVSEQLALQTGVWHIAPTGRDYLSNDGRSTPVSPPPPLTLSPAACRRFHHHLRRREARALALFDGHALHRLTYEQLTSDWPAAIHSVQSFLAIQPEPLTPTTERQQQRPLAAVVQNLFDLRPLAAAK